MKHSSSLLAYLLIYLFSFSLRAEVPPPNPFSGDQGLPPGSEYQEEDDFLDPGNNFGFQAPQNLNAPAEVPSNTQPAAPATPPSNQARQTPPGPPGPGRTSLPVATPSNSNQKNKKVKAAPKLADYLELDPSVKSLEVKNFDLPDKEIKDVVTLISKWTGKNFIIDSKVRGKITIMGPSAVSLQEAYQAFLSSLEANGLTTVQAGKYIRIIDSAEARRAPVKTYTGDYAPKDDQFITRIFQLKFINADEVQRDFRDLTTRQGKLFAYEPTNSIIITDTGSNIQRIKEILEVLDVKNYETTLHVLHIKNGAAKSIADMLGEIYSEGKGAPGQPRSFRKSALERTRGGGVISKIIPDEQTNSLIVLANVAGFEQLKQLVSKLDVKVTDTGRIHVYYCEYTKAEDLATTLSSLATGSPGGGRKSGAGGTAPGGNTGPVSSGPVTANLEGGVKITSDASTNALVITANSADYQTMKKVIKKLDIPRLQVFVQTAILEVAIDDSTTIGVNAALGAPGRGFAGGFIGDTDTLSTALLNGLPGEGATIPILGGPAFTATGPFGTNGASTNITVNTFMGLLKLLTKTTNSSILSTPQIIAMDNEKAEFQVLDETPVQTTLTTASTTTAATGSIERLKTGIVIKLTPHVNAASRNIRLEIEQKVDSTRPSTSVPAALADIQVATTSRVTNTSVVVKDQDYLMMGGLMQDRLEETIAKVPLLGDIPILGWLFESKTFRKQKTNLVILMHPKIIGTSLEAAAEIKSNLEKRDQFIGEHFGGDDPHLKRVKKLKDDINEQETRGETDPIFDYRNNQEDDSLDAPKPEAKTELGIKNKAETVKPVDPVKEEPKPENKETPPAEIPAEESSDAPLLIPPTESEN